MKLIFFAPWWNPNCALVVSDNSGKYVIYLIIYEPTDLKMPEVFKIIKILKNIGQKEKVKNKLEELKKRLNSDNPILAMIEKNNFSLLGIMEKFILSSNVNPDEYLKPLDIVWRKIGGIVPAHHSAIYLGDKQVVHITAYSLFIGQLKEHQAKLENEKIPREEHETDKWLKDQIDKLKQILANEKVQREKNTNVIEREDTEARISDWEYFLRKSKEDLIRCHLIIPFKRPKEITEHIAKAVFSQYAKEEYNLITNNCQHFATLCVCGVPFSEQVNKFKLLSSRFSLTEEIEKSNQTFKKVDLKKILFWEIGEKLTNYIATSKELNLEESWGQLFALIYFYKQARRQGKENKKWLKNIRGRLKKKLDEKEISSLCQSYKELVEIGESFPFERDKQEMLTKHSTDWANIYPNFASELITQWQSLNFTYLQIRDWINIGLQPTDANFASWLRDSKQLTPEEVLNSGDYQKLSQEFFGWKQEQIEIFPKGKIN